MNDPNENRPGYKQTKVGWIPEEWRVDRLDRFLVLKRGFDLTKETSTPGDVPVVSSSGATYYHNQAKVEPPGVVTGRKGILGNVFYLETPFWPHDTSLWVCDFKGNAHIFVYWFLQGMRLQQFDAATSVPTLNRNNIHSIRVAFPPLPEQRKIAAILSTWDDAIEQTRDLIRAKKQQKKAIKQQLLTGKRRLPGFAGERKHVRLKSVASIPKKVQLCSVEGETLLTVKLHCLGIERNECIHPKLTEKGRPYFKRHAGELLIGRQNFHNGGFGILPKNFNGLIASSAITSLIVDSTKISERFLLLVWSNPDYYKHVGHRMDGTGQKELSEKQIMRLDIPLPPLPEQRAIAAVLDTADREIAAIEAKHKALQRQKKGLMQRLLTGQVRVKG